MQPTRTRRHLSAVPDPGSGLDSLTPREREVLELIAAGRSNEGIREALFLSPKTVESHVRSIFLKLDLRSGDARTHARVLAARAWLGSQTSSLGMEAVRRAA
jgi:DNA-binding NarL/FixJ family response regulator